jgi:hypothetical protein
LEGWRGREDNNSKNLSKIGSWNSAVQFFEKGRSNEKFIRIQTP